MGEEIKDRSRRNAELVLYPEQMDDMLQVLKSGWVKKWAWILHDKDQKSDGTQKDPHIHLMCSWEKKTTKDSVIANKFGCRRNQIEGIKGTWADAVDYLTHHNAPDKYQYDASEVHANFDWESDARQSKTSRRERLEALLESIATGEVREYNLTEHVTVIEYVRNRRAIDSAFKWRKNEVMAHLEELVAVKDIIWIYGETGTGKTTLAKQLAKAGKLYYALTSTGRNMFDEYRDEPCLIIDDLRPDDMRFSDLLGILDPYNFKAAQARYANKALQAQMVIVTTTYSPERFCKEANGDELTAEDERQLYRRINSVYEVRNKELLEYEYNDECTVRDMTRRYPNPFKTLAKRERQRHHDLVEKALTSVILSD